MAVPTRARSAGRSASHSVMGTASRLAQTLTFAAALTSTWTGVRLAGVNLVDILLVLAVGFSLLAAASSGQRLPIYAWAVIPPASLLAIALIGAVVRGDPLSSSRAGWERVVGSAVGAEYTGALPLVARMTLALTAVAIVLAGVANNARDRRATVEKIIFTWAVGAAISAAYGVAQYMGGFSNLPFLYQIVTDTRTSGLGNHPNSFGQTIAYALPVQLYMAGASRGIFKGLTVLSVPVSMYAIFLSGSRAAILCGAIVFVLASIYLLGSARRLHFWGPLTATLLSAAAIVALPTVLSDTRFFDQSGQLSNSLRRANLNRGLDLFNSNPLFGSGVGSWNSEMVPLIVLTSGGVLYFAIYYGSLIHPLLVRSRMPEGRFVAILVISILGFFAYGLLNNGFVERYLYWPFAALFALSLEQSPMRPEKSGTTGDSIAAHAQAKPTRRSVAFHSNAKTRQFGSGRTV